MYPVVKQAERIRFRELRSNDAGDVFRLYNDQTVTYNLSFDSRSEGQIDALIRTAAAAAKLDPRIEYLLATELLDGTFIGIARLALDQEPVDLEQVVEKPHSAQLGGALTADIWRQGYGIEAARLLLDTGFNDLGLHRLWGACGPENINSKRLMENLGMKEESRLRDHVFTNGAWRDSIVHAILRDEYLVDNR